MTQKFETSALVKIAKNTEGKPLRRDDVIVETDF